MPADHSNRSPSDQPTDPPWTRGSPKAVQSDAASRSGSTWKKPGDADPSPEGLLRYEHYEVLHHPDGSIWELGRGAMGVTYKALDTRLHYHVALKVISISLTGYPAARERFLREARTAARLHHPNVARVFHLGETNGGTEAFYAMEFVEGETLEARVRRVGPLSIWLVLEVGIEVARALVAACHQDLIHRDLKPANLMLVASAEAATVAAVGTESSRGEANEAWVKVIDFGLAKAAAEVGPLTGADDFIGTPAYASPEQFSSNARGVDGRSDIYSLGGTLWYALTGKMPFEGGSFTEIERQKRSVEVRPARLTVAGVPAPLARLLTSMLAVDPGDRPQTPSVLLETMRRCREELRLLAPAGAGQRPLDSFSWVPLRSFKHRRIYQVFFAYAVGAWLVLQIAAILLPGLDWPRWIMRPLIVMFVAGFGEALLVGWALDRQAAGKARLPQRPLRRLGFVLLALAPAVAVAAFFLWHPAPAAASNEPAFVHSDNPIEPISAKSIAVLPFENLSADKDNAFFTDGVQDEILTDLSKIADLKVISRTSVMQYQGTGKRNLRAVGQELGVAHLLEGSVQRVGNTVRVTVQLIDARTDVHSWAEHYDRPLDDVFGIQTDIAEAIAGQLQARLSPQEKNAIDSPPTKDLTAYNLYLRAQNLNAASGSPDYPMEKFSETAHLLDEALERDPKFLLAWCLLARVHCEVYFSGHDHTPARLQRAYDAVQRALGLQPDAGEAHLALADYYHHGLHDYVAARAELNLARRTLPNSSQVDEYSGYIDRRQGLWMQATHEMERALELDPRNLFLLNQLAVNYQYLRRYDDQARVYDRMLSIVPGDPTTRIQRAQVEIDARADTRPFQTAFAAVLAENPRVGPDVDDPFNGLCERTRAAAARVLADYPFEGVPVHGTVYPRAYWEGVVARWEGDVPRARAAFGTARTDVEKASAAQPDTAAALSLLGMIDAGLGHKETAIAEGRRACELLPTSKDAVDGAWIAINLAQTLAWSGEKAAAVEQLATIERSPTPLSYGLLKLHPVWDDLRSEPRFAALVASMAPKPPSP